MLTHHEFVQLEEWQEFVRELGKQFQIHTESAVTEEKDIGNVRYHKGWIDAVNFLLDLPRLLLPDPHDDKETFVTNEEPGESFIASRKDGSVY